MFDGEVWQDAGTGGSGGGLTPGDVINALNSVVTNKPLSANMGRVLAEAIEVLKARGRYLSVWDCTTGLAKTVPTVDPYEYKTGDYFIVGVVADEDGTNYRPDGSEYSADTPSTVEETDPVHPNDTYYYDGEEWTLLSVGQIASTFAALAGSPMDNTLLAAALNGKVSVRETITDSSSTAPTLASVEGGKDYVFTQSLTSLTVTASAVSTNEATISFKAGSGFTLTMPTGMKQMGGSVTFEANHEYTIAIWQNWYIVGVEG